MRSISSGRSECETNQLRYHRHSWPLGDCWEHDQAEVCKYDVDHATIFLMLPSSSVLRYLKVLRILRDMRSRSQSFSHQHVSDGSTIAAESIGTSWYILDTRQSTVGLIALSSQRVCSRRIIFVARSRMAIDIPAAHQPSAPRKLNLRSRSALGCPDMELTIPCHAQSRLPIRGMGSRAYRQQRTSHQSLPLPQATR